MEPTSNGSVNGTLTDPIPFTDAEHQAQYDLLRSTGVAGTDGRDLYQMSLADLLEGAFARAPGSDIGTGLLDLIAMMAGRLGETVEFVEGGMSDEAIRDDLHRIECLAQYGSEIVRRVNHARERPNAKKASPVRS
jgi:hypothetical protein